MSEVVLSLGSNLGDRFLWMEKMECEVECISWEVLARSPLYETDPVGVSENHPPYLNRVIKIKTDKSPEELLGSLKKIERKLDREGKGKLLPRTADIDILLFENETREGNELTIPHHALFKRRFEIEGVKSVAGDWHIVELGIKFSEFELDKQVANQAIKVLNV
jgi:2-amino-4-hydroxy-6-hydroxymethyldihydropteridine diphosphokinase